MLVQPGTNTKISRFWPSIDMESHKNKTLMFYKQYKFALWVPDFANQYKYLCRSQEGKSQFCEDFACTVKEWTIFP